MILHVEETPVTKFLFVSIFLSSALHVSCDLLVHIHLVGFPSSFLSRNELAGHDGEAFCVGCRQIIGAGFWSCVVFYVQRSEEFQ